MKDFTSSDGVNVFVEEYVTDKGPAVWVDGHRLSPLDTSALREFFRAEEDERLGRWRCPENPDYVVYPMLPLRARVVDERRGIGIEFTEVDTRLKRSSYERRAARAFFDAHPEPKPWELAGDNEIWALTGAGGMVLPWRRTEDGGWESITPKAIRRRNVDLITDGRRIWPEGTS